MKMYKPMGASRIQSLKENMAVKFTTHSHDGMTSNGVSINGREWSSQTTPTTPFVARLAHFFYVPIKVIQKCGGSAIFPNVGGVGERRGGCE